MSYAELAAHQLYDSMQLDNVSEEVKRHLIILMLSNPEKKQDVQEHETRVPLNYAEAIEMGAIDIEMAREDLHSYVDELAIQYDLK